uniref:SAP domain-containing protein n=1 Tax=Setaria italica TaxID=4555 RepID=K3ZR26_SETIT
MVAELKDELQRRNLPVSGLKNDLVKRLFEAIQDKILDDGEKTNGGIPPEELKGGETPGSVDASVNQASIKELVDEGASEVMKQGADLVISVTEAYDESILTTSEVTQEAVVGTPEASQRSLDAVARVESSLVDTAATDETNGNGLESASSGDTIVEEANPRSDNHCDTIEQTPEDDTNKKLAIDDIPSDGTGGDIKLGLNMHIKILEMGDVYAPSDDTVLGADPEDADAVVAAEPEDDTSKKMTIDGVLSDANHTTEKVPALPDAIELNADPKGADVVVAAENMIPKDNFSVNTLMHGNGHGDFKCSNGDTKPFLCREKDQVSEVNPDLDSQTKCVSIFDDNISADKNNDLKGNLNADDCDLELDAKQEMVKPSSTIPSPGDLLEVLDVDKEVHKIGATLQELGSTSDESMDEDVLESKHIDSNIKSDDLGEKTEFTSEHGLKEVSLLDTAAEDSSAHTKEVVVEEKPPSPAEKRKPEDQEVIANNEPIKRQRLRNVNDVDISEQKAPKLTGTGTTKEVFHYAPSHSFGRPGTTASRDYPKERIVPPAQKPATTSLRIDRFVRPFTLKAVQELIGKTGSVCSFWMDHIKTHCYVTYSSVEEAVATRNAIYNLQWPPNNRNYLVAEFVDPEEVELKLEAPPPSQVPISLSTAIAPQAAPFQQPNANQTLPPQPAAALLPTPAPLAKLPPISGPGPAREMLLPPPPRNLEPPRTLDDLFKKTQVHPRIYYMPLSE